MSFGRGSGDRYGRGPEDENQEEKALRLVEQLKAARVEQSKRLDQWWVERQAILDELEPAAVRAQEAHEFVVNTAANIQKANRQLQLLANSTTIANRRRGRNRPAEDEYGNISAEAEIQQLVQNDHDLYQFRRNIEHMQRMYESYKSDDQEAQERYKALKDERDLNEKYIKKIKSEIVRLDADIKRWKEFLIAQERRRRQQDLHPKWPPGDGPGGPNGWDSGGGGSSGGRQGHGGPFGYGGGRYAADYESRSRGGASHGSQTYGGSGGHRRAAGQTYATPDGKHKQDVADKLATLALDGEQHRPESKPAASKTSKTKPAAAPTGPTTRIRANPPGQAGGGQRPSRR
jgi:chemotaxis protein histidine kinase CheA